MIIRRQKYKEKSKRWQHKEKSEFVIHYWLNFAKNTKIPKCINIEIVPAASVYELEAELLG